LHVAPVSRGVPVAGLGAPTDFVHHPAAFVYHNYLQSNNLDRRGIFS
jgi:hypothetical protein